MSDIRRACAVGIDDGQMEPEARLRLLYFLGGRVASPQ